MWPLILTIIVTILIASNSLQKVKEKEETLEQLQRSNPNAIKLNAECNEIVLSTRDKSHRNCFAIENYVSTRHGYSEEKLIFTSATVGGVTTGGWDKVGGFGTEEKKTDKYNILYEYFDNEEKKIKKVEVKTIFLSDALIEQAKNSNVKEYLDCGSIIVVEPIVSSDDKIQGYVNLHRIRGGGYTTHIANTIEDDKIRALPDLEKCKKILNWVCGEE